MNERRVVDAGGQMGQQFAHPLAALPVPGELPGRLHHGAALAEKRGDGVGPLRLLAVVFDELRLVVVGVDGAQAAGQEDHDQPLGLGREMGAFALQQLRQRQSRGAAAHIPK